MNIFIDYVNCIHWSMTTFLHLEPLSPVLIKENLVGLLAKSVYKHH